MVETQTPKSLCKLLAGNPYPGRGLAVGFTPDGKSGVIVYFIMGRSANSRNRIFEEVESDVYTRAYDESKVEDPSLILYAPVRTLLVADYFYVIATNGDQTDTVFHALKDGKTFESALATRCFEPDAPNYTPRISGLLRCSKQNEPDYTLSILKSADAEGHYCNRFFYDYPKRPGAGHFLSTYVTDGSPLPSFSGEPVPIDIPGDVQAFAGDIWENLDENNKISLYVRKLDLETLASESVLINRHGRNEGSAT